MKRLFRRRWLFLAFITMVLLAGLYVWLVTRPDAGRITKANYDKIQVGMTTKEVNELLGEDAARPIMQIWPDGHTGQVGAIYVTADSGILPRPQIILEFADHCVTTKHFREADWTLPSLLAAMGLKNPSPTPSPVRPPSPPVASLPSPRPGAPAAPGPAARP